MHNAEFNVGQTVELNDGRIAVIRFAGNTQFASGEWLGVELRNSSGKNDGSIQGYRYFDCSPGHGMFVRPSVASVIDLPAPKSTKRNSAAANDGAIKSRPLSRSSIGLAGRRQSILDPANKPRSTNAASPTPAARAPVSRKLRSPTKSPTKISTKSPGAGLTKAAPQATAKVPLTAARRTSVLGRQSLASLNGASSTARSSISASLNEFAHTPVTSRKPPDGRISTLTQEGGQSSATGHENADFTTRISSNKSLGKDDKSPGNNTGSNSRPDSPSSPQKQAPLWSRSEAPAPRATNSNSAANREIEDLRTKLKLMEKKRSEDRDKLKSMEKVQAERDKFESIIQKLQTKMQPQQQEILDLRKQLKEANANIEARESQEMDLDTAVEMATLDREMAEETAESYKTELDTIRSKYEELQLEAEILKDENSELGKVMSPEERTSQGWVHMERENERLREALLRLRDMTQEQEAGLRDQLQELQSDSAELASVREKYDEAQFKVNRTELAVEDLRQQLDNALGAEEIIEELTEKNMALAERIDELKVAIEDLESLKELNDELELNHTENEKQLQDEVDYREALYVEQVRRCNLQDEAITELEYTISRFRELVINLQGDLEHVRASQQITENEATELNSRSKTMMDLNLRLQASASKAQNKTIEMEVGKLEAQQASDHLSIVQCFLPEGYAINKDSVHAYLRIKRIDFKSNLLYGFIKERARGVAILGHEEDVFAACVMLDELTWVSATCQRFVRFIRQCSQQSFKKLAAALYDLDPVERTLNAWIDGLKRDELREQQCVRELQRSVALISHLAEVHVPESLQQHAEELQVRVLVMQSRIENAGVAVMQMKSVVQAKIILPTDADEEDEASAKIFLEKADSLIAQMRSTKVMASKIVHQIRELQSRSLTLDPSTLPATEQTDRMVADLVSSCQSAASDLLKVINEEGRAASFSYHEVTRVISSQDIDPFDQLHAQSQGVATEVQHFHDLAFTLSQAVEFSASSVQAPWDILSESLKAEALASASHEKEALRLKDELAEKNTAVVIKEKVIEELNVNIEVLSKRVNDSGGRKERLKELELVIEASRSKEQETAGKVTSLQRELQLLESQRDVWTTQSPTTGAAASPRVAELSRDEVAACAELKAQLVSVKQRVKRANTALRQVRQSGQRASILPDKTLLSEPLAMKPERGLRHSLGLESSGVYRSMLDALENPAFKVLRLRQFEREQRLAWRPARETPRWHAEQLREQWEMWREWQRDTSKARHSEPPRQKKPIRTVRTNRMAADIFGKIGIDVAVKDWDQLDARGVTAIDSSE